MSADPGTRRALPSLDRLLNDSRAVALAERFGRPAVARTLRDLLAERRAALARAPAVTTPFDVPAAIEACATRLQSEALPSLRPVFNLTGTVLHTNLGRAVMPRCAVEAVVQAMTRPVNLEYDLSGARRGERDGHVVRRLVRLTGAETAVVVNNNAAAVYLALNTLAPRREVLVSRGELIEIGGSFRMPDIMARAGCRLVEVGTTNRTHLADYAGAIGPRTGAIMKVHASNYAIQGYTASVAEADLAGLAHAHGLPFIVDLGSGTLVDLERFGLPHEPTPREALAHGADVVSFSGDKLLGGPQAGILVGRDEHLARIRKNPMKRALRVDKMTLAALEAVLALYADPNRLEAQLPTLRWLARRPADIEAAARRVLPHLAAALAGRAQARVAACTSQAGSGALPLASLPSAAIVVEAPGRRGDAVVRRIAEALRALPVPVIGRISDSALVLDMRCLDDEAGLIAQLGRLELERT